MPIDITLNYQIIVWCVLIEEYPATHNHFDVEVPECLSIENYFYLKIAI